MSKITVVKIFIVQVPMGKAPDKSFANTDGFKGLAGKLSQSTQNVFGFFSNWSKFINIFCQGTLT
jgi:hypothetical protein